MFETSNLKKLRKREANAEREKEERRETGVESK